MPAGSCALVIGGGGGLGRAFVRLLAEDPEFSTIFASSRRAGELGHAIRRVEVLQMDLRSEESIASAVGALRQGLGSEERSSALRLVINCAGILHDDSGLRPEKRVADLHPASIETAFQVNVIGHMLAAKYLLPLLPRRGRVVYAALSARVGSISDNRLGGWYSYRASKAAQNMFMKGLAIELTRHNGDAVVASLHPGTVATPLSEPFRSGVPPEKLFSPDVAASRLLEVLRGLGPECTGGFWAWDGSRIAW